MQRTIVVWLPDWPITAAVRAGLALAETPLAIVSANRVVACSAAARADGVRVGHRRRQAQSLCPALLVLPADENRDHRFFAPIIDRVEGLAAGVQVMRPGLLALAARGPSRYYGGERAAALALSRALRDDLTDVRIGIADGPFAAEQAARAAVVDGHERGVCIVTEGESAAFLAPFPVSVLGDSTFEALLRRLGVHTLGDFAALSAASVRDRFGAAGAYRHALAGAVEAPPIVPRTPPPDLEQVLDLEPALTRVDQVAFAVRQCADDLVASLTARRLVATAIRVVVRDDNGAETSRAWLHPRSFRASEVVDRVRWQLSGETRILGAPTETPRGAGLRAAVTQVRISPESVDDLHHYEPGLWGGPPDERVHHALSRVQSMLGHEAVLTPRRVGGRTLEHRSLLVPWGDRAVTPRPLERPWPGALPQPAPSTVFPTRHPVSVVDEEGAVIGIDERMRLSGEPTAFVPSAGGVARPIRSWAGPWPLDEQWWSIRRRLHRLQVVDAHGVAWLLILEGGSWWAEARYD